MNVNMVPETTSLESSNTITILFIDQLGDYLSLTWDGKRWVITDVTGKALKEGIKDQHHAISSMVDYPYLVKYTNSRGETSIRFIDPKTLWWGSTSYHPEDQWFLTAIDRERGVSRDFALKDFSEVEEPSSTTYV